MHHTRKRLIGMAMLCLALLASVSVTQARWSSGDIGFTNMERVCRDGAIVSMAANSAGATGFAGARRHDNLAAAPEPNKAFGNDPPRPLSDYGPNIVAAPAIRPVAITAQDLARELPISLGNGAPDVVQNYGVVILPWSAPQPPGTPVVLVYRRLDAMDVGIAEEIVADCLIGAANAQVIAPNTLPGGDSAIPIAQLTYQLTGWPKYGHLLRDGQPLGLGTRFSAADLAGHALSYTTSRTPLGDQLPISVVGTDLVSRITDRPANTNSANYPAISGDGRYVAFESLASTLVTSDTNTAHDIFVFDRQTGQTTRASLSSSGAQANNSSTSAAISGDGRYVAFQSSATNLVGADTNSNGDVFVRDRQTNQTSRVSISSSGAQADDASTDPALSADGRYVAFVSAATNLVSSDTNGQRDIFLHDRQTSQTTRISVGAGGAQADGESDSPAISGDGHLIAFHSSATNLLAANADTNAIDDIFVYNRLTGQTTLASVSSSGSQADASSTAPAISADGSTIAFASIATNLAPINTNGQKNIYLHNLQTGQTIWVSHPLDAAIAPDADSDIPSISGDGRFVAFSSLADNLVGYDAKTIQDIFLYDRQNDAITCLSVSTDGSAADGASTNPAISSDGRFTAIEAYAHNLLPNPIISSGDIYVRYHATANVVVGLPYQVYSPLTQK